MKLLLLFVLMGLSITNGFSQTPKRTEVFSLNGSDIYFEVYGKGEPLFLLHGYTQSSKSWRPFLADYTDDFEVYLVDLKGHGKSGPFKEKLSIKAAARDVNALIHHLKLKSIHAIGFSYGGDVLFQMAIMQPGLIKSMISIGACGSWDAKDYPDWVENLSYKNRDNLKWMREQQLSEAQIKTILDQFPNYSVSVSEEEMKSIRAKVLVLLGDQDNSIPLESVAMARKNLPDFYLWILPNSGHGAHEGQNKEEFIRVSKVFFSGKWNK